MGEGDSFDKSEMGEDYLPEIVDVEYNSDRMSIKLTVKLIPNKNYIFMATHYGFKSKNGVPIKDYRINFETK